MADLFSSAKSTLRRAQHHIGDLSARLKALVKEHAWAYDIDRDTDGVTEVHKIKLWKPFPDDLPCIIFDAVNNLRACLDQTSYAACAANGCSALDFAYFPIVRGEEFYADKINGIKGLHPEIRTLFAAFKPYKGGNSSFWALNELCNTKKHARLIPATLGNFVIEFTASTIETPSFGPPFFDAEKNQVILGKIAPNPDRGTNTKITYAIVFDHPSEIINRQNPVAFLDTARCEVERVLMATEMECRRVGLIP